MRATRPAPGRRCRSPCSKPSSMGKVPPGQRAESHGKDSHAPMCDACDTPLHQFSPPPGDDVGPDVASAGLIDRRGLLVTAGLGGLVAAATAIGLPDAIAGAMAPPFETALLGED